VLGLLSLAATAFIVGFSGAMVPGPLTAMTITESSRRGFRAGPLLTLGHAIAEAVIVILLALGLNRIFQMSLVSGLIAALGGAVLVWMGIDIVRAAWRGQMRLAGEGAPVERVAAVSDVRTGILVSISNPYWILWWATVGAAYVVVALGYGALGLLALFVGHILSDLSWNSLLALAASSGRRIISQRVYQAALIVCGAFLVFMGGSFIVAGVRFLSALIR
jgi:threonine/homoserine/homoserine lactone efflux protein